MSVIDKIITVVDSSTAWASNYAVYGLPGCITGFPVRVKNFSRVISEFGHVGQVTTSSSSCQDYEILTPWCHGVILRV